MSTSETEYLIVGAGLSGLSCAYLLKLAGRSFRVIEARSEAGGRIRSVLNENNQFVGDLGPTWVWPKYQPVAQQWISQLGLNVFNQYDVGQTLIDSGPGVSVQRYPVPGQDGSVRVAGGTTAMINALKATLLDDAIDFDTPASVISCGADHVEVQSGHSSGKSYRASKLICAVPPRIALTRIRWEPTLPEDLQGILADTPTWMAPQAKVVATFDEPFWRKQRLSGRIMSRTGPIGEAHDHCSEDGADAAIFGFLAWPVARRKEHAGVLVDEMADQLTRCFGTAPNNLFLQDWADERTVTTPDDLSGPIEHPTVRPDQLRNAIAGERIRFAVAEASALSPGLIEGALDSATQTVQAFLGASA